MYLVTRDMKTFDNACITALLSVYVNLFVHYAFLKELFTTLEGASTNPFCYFTNFISLFVSATLTL